MKFLRKINKGLVLTIIVLVVLVIYLINVEVKRNAEKPHIEEAVKEYIELVDKYAVMPSEYQKLYSPTTSKEQAEKLYEQFEKAVSEHIEKYEEELKTKMIDNKTAIDMQKGVLEDVIIDGNDILESVTTKFDREITKIKKYAFDDDQVTVTFNSKVEVETKYLEETKERTKKSSQDIEDESITLKMVDGTWKVIYADLRYSTNMSMGMFGISY